MDHELSDIQGGFRNAEEPEIKLPTSAGSSKKQESFRKISISPKFTEAEKVQFSSVQSFSRVRLFATPWTAAYQAPLSMQFSRQEYWNKLPFLTPRDLLNPGIEPTSLLSPALADGFFTTALPGNPSNTNYE